MTPSKKLWLVLGGAPLLILVLIGAFVFLGDSLEAPRGYVTEDGLVFDSKHLLDPIPLDSIRISEARLVNSRTETEYRLTRKDNGIAISGYRVGWFRLSSGEKVFVSLDSESQALYVPTDSGFSLLIDGNSGMELLATLKENMNDA